MKVRMKKERMSLVFAGAGTMGLKPHMVIIQKDINNRTDYMVIKHIIDASTLEVVRAAWFVKLIVKMKAIVRRILQ